MTHPEHITRIIERLDPVDREALEQHLEDKSIMGDLMRLQEIRQAIGDPHGKLMQGEVVEKVQLLSQQCEKLRQERDELAASIYIIEAAEELTYPSDDCAHAGDYIKQLRAAIMEAPATNLAEVRAQAIDDHLDPITMSMAPSNDYFLGWNDAMRRMSAHANKIRKEAQ